jgi:hypothetical protein
MKTILKIFGLCFLTVFGLCLNINGKPVFEPVYSALSHVTIPFQNATGSLLANAMKSTQEYSRKIFNNSVPKMKDAVKSRASAPTRNPTKGVPSEVIMVEEKEELDDLIKSHY